MSRQRNTHFATWPLIGIFLLLIFASTSLAANKDDGVDVLFILDTSGSMKHNDAHDLRVQAAKMFVTLLTENDRVAIMRFAGSAQLVTNLLPLNKTANEDSLLKAIENISSSGAKTNITLALQKGFELLQKNRLPNRQQQIVLMSDGNMDVGNKATDVTLTEKILGDLTPAMAQKRVKVNSIAFTDTSNIPLLQLAANDTKGYFTILKSASGIHEVFESIFERSKSPDMLPMNNDTFIVDSDIKELTIVASKYKPNSRVALETPNGDTLFPDTTHPSVRWVSAKQFDIITVKNPTSGYWILKFTEGGDRAYVVSDLKLKIEAATEVAPNEEFEAHIFLEKDGKRITDKRIINNTKFILEITDPGGKKSKHVLSLAKNQDAQNRSGLFAATLALKTTGTYKLEASTANDLFDRKKSFFVTVAAPDTTEPFKVLDEQTPAPVVAHAEKPAEATPSHEQKPTEHPAAPTAEKHAAPAAEGSEQPAAHAPPPDEHAATPADAHAAAPADEASSEKPAEETPPHDAATDAAPAEKDNSGKKAMVGFLIFNVVAAFAALGFFGYRKYKAKKSPLGGKKAKNKDKAGGGSASEKPAAEELQDIDLNEIDEEGALEEDLEQAMNSITDDLDLDSKDSS